MYVITSSASNINIVFNMDDVTLEKSGLFGVSKASNTLRFNSSTGEGIYYIDFAKGVIIDGVTQTSLTMCKSSLVNLIKKGIIETFLATAGQTTFPTLFNASTSDTRIYVGGARVMTGWTFPAGVSTYAAGMVGGEEVIIEKV
jgi:hypothetical protein